MLRHVLTLLALLSIPATQAAGQQRTVVAVPGYSVLVELDTLGSSSVHGATRARVFRAMVDTYRELKIPLALVDSAGGRVGNWGYKRSGSMAGRQMSAWLHCGEGMTGPVADHYRITMWIYSTVRARGADSTTLATALVAGATNLGGDSRQPLPCASTGRLEERIRAMIEERLRAGP